MEASMQPGEILLGKYRVERVLGQGGMGVVIAARHLELGELFAIKCMLPHALEDADAVSRFLREARAAARLKGEHVVRVHDVGRLHTGAPYMVLEHLVGSDLKELIRTQGALPLEQAVSYMLQVCDAMAEAHALGIIHRDLKPSNLFLTRRPNGGPCVKVLDFGISKQRTSEGGDLTKSGAVLGSPLYMSPEQMVRSKDVDARSDVWAMGVVLYELVTAVPPFVAPTFPEVIALILQEEPTPPSQVRSALPNSLDGIVARCLQKRPEQRFQSIDALAAALRPLLAAAGREATPVRTPRPGELSRTEPAQWPGAVTGSAWGRTGAQHRSLSVGRKAVAAVGAALAVVALGGTIRWLTVRSQSDAHVGAEPGAPDAPTTLATAGALADSAASQPSSDAVLDPAGQASAVVNRPTLPVASVREAITATPARTNESTTSSTNTSQGSRSVPEAADPSNATSVQIKPMRPTNAAPPKPASTPTATAHSRRNGGSAFDGRF